MQLKPVPDIYEDDGSQILDDDDDLEISDCVVEDSDNVESDHEEVDDGVDQSKQQIHDVGSDRKPR